MAPAGSAGLQFGDTRIALDAHGNGGMAWRLYESPENQAAVVGSIQGGMMYSLD